DGRLQSRSFDNQEGKRVFVTEVVADSVQFLESKGGSSQGGGGSQGSGFQPNQNQPSNQNNNNYNQNDDPFADKGETIDISDDDLPF
ncbi:single-stranded DNA-binding protein, partial [Enterobacter quasiroggenkampii]